MNIIWKVGCWASVFVLAIIAVILLRAQFLSPDNSAANPVHTIALKESPNARHSPYDNGPYLGTLSVDEKGRPSGLPQNPR